MKVSQILKEKGEKVITTKPQTTVYEVIQLMNKHHIGAVMVVDESDKILGIVTERDVMRRCLTTPDPDLKMPVEKLMTKHLIVGVEEDNIQYVMGVMTKNKIRHLPIVKDGHLAGIISIGDAVKTQLEEAEHENRLLVDYISHPS